MHAVPIEVRFMRTLIKLNLSMSVFIELSDWIELQFFEWWIELQFTWMSWFALASLHGQTIPMTIVVMVGSKNEKWSGKQKQEMKHLKTYEMWNWDLNHKCEKRMGNKA